MKNVHSLRNTDPTELHAVERTTPVAGHVPCLSALGGEAFIVHTFHLHIEQGTVLYVDVTNTQVNSWWPGIRLVERDPHDVPSLGTVDGPVLHGTTVDDT